MCRSINHFLRRAIFEDNVCSRQITRKACLFFKDLKVLEARYRLCPIMQGATVV